VFPASERSDAITAEARRAVADLVGGGGDGSGVVLGPNMTTLTFRFAWTLALDWAPGDEIVVSRLDHDANIRPWIHAAERTGVTVRWAEIDPSTGQLPTNQYDALLNDRTRLVAVTAASNILGIKPDVAAIAAKAHAAGALTYVDGVHATAHGPADMAALGADFYATSSYKWSGPHLGAVVADPALLETLRPYKLRPSSDEVPHRFETGTLPFADLAGLTAAVDHLASLDPAAASLGDRRARLLASLAAAEAHELDLYGTLVDGLEKIPGVRTYGQSEHRTATAYFTVAGKTPGQVAEHLAAQRINVWSGHCYAWELTGALGIRDADSAVRAGLVHYNDHEDVERLLTAVADLAP
jgi:cysteine desulfurase family protein (TIGR01976 family)